MYPRTNYEMSQEDLDAILKACEPVPVMKIGNAPMANQQQRANWAWETLGKKMGFDPTTVQPILGEGHRFFSAVPSETKEHKEERLKRESEEKRLAETEELEKEIREKQERLASLKGT